MTTPTPTKGNAMTPALLAHRIATDVVATAERYPAIRGCRSFSALHDVYDANESIIAAVNGEVHPDDEAWTDGINAATDLVDAILATTGFAGLVRFSQTSTLTPADIAAIIAEYDRIVRINETTRAVAEDECGEVVWEVWATANDLGYDLSDADRDALQDASDVYKARLQAEIAGSVPDLVPVAVAIGDGPVFFGLHDPATTWNGWACPTFDRDEANRVVEWTRTLAAEFPDTEVGSWDGDDVLLTAPGGYVERIAPDAHGRYAIGAHGWVWEVAS